MNSYALCTNHYLAETYRRKNQKFVFMTEIHSTRATTTVRK